MPRKPALRFSHTQASGQEIFFGDRRGYLVEMIDLFGDKPKRKTKRGSWGLGIPLIFKRRK